MSLNSAKKITRRSWDLIPMPDTVIQRVNLIAKDQPEQLMFTDRSGRQIGDVEIPGVDSGTTSSAPQTAIDDEEEEVVEADSEVLDPDNDTNMNEEQEIDQELEAAVEPEPNRIEPDDEPVGVESLETIQEDEQRQVQFEPDPVEVEPTAAMEETGEDQHQIPGVRRSARVRTQTNPGYEPSMSGKKYEYIAAQYEDHGVMHPDAHMMEPNGMYPAEPDVVAMIMTQLSLKVGLDTWGEKAKTAAVHEMKQLHYRETFKPKHWHELTTEEKKTVLESHMFLKLKRDNSIKGRTVAGGNKQRDFISKEDSSSPTVATESVLLTCIIDAEEGRDVAVIDIPNAFIQTRVEDEKDMVIIKIRGILVDILVEIAPGFYDDYVTKDKKGIKQLLVQCQNAIYGTMVASLLYYNKFSNSLIKKGFKFNPYDPCVANKIIQGKQMTICFHVDDCKLSHELPEVMDSTIEWLRQEYESIFEDGTGQMTVSRGKVHTYLGMKLDFSVKGIVKITMFPNVEDIIKTFEEADPGAKGHKKSAAPENLFVVNEDCEKLSVDRAVTFHKITAKTLYVTKRARPDTSTSVAFLTTRVRGPDTDDWKKLKHLVQYLRATKELPLILSANGSGIIKWWVDGSFAVHPNMRGHTGGGMSMGRGFPINMSTKHKINTKSSTESELVSVDDCMPSICWTRYFVLAQGYGVNENLLFQDNRSAILLEKNGKASSSKRTKHIHIRYFFVTDRIKNKELSVMWCPTADMIGDFFTKPCQGALFIKFRDQIMGVVPAADPGPGKIKVPAKSGKK